MNRTHKGMVHVGVNDTTVCIRQFRRIVKYSNMNTEGIQERKRVEFMFDINNICRKTKIKNSSLLLHIMDASVLIQ